VSSVCFEISRSPPFIIVNRSTVVHTLLFEALNSNDKTQCIPLPGQEQQSGTNANAAKGNS
jgi:hypothetical protein